MNSPKTKKEPSKKLGVVALIEELDLMTDIVFRLNLPQQMPRRIKKKSAAVKKIEISNVPTSVTFRARRYPVCTSAFPKSTETPSAPLGDVDELLRWPVLHHTVSWIYGVHVMDLTKVFKRSISRQTMMEDAVARVGGRSSLDLIFPSLSRDNFHRMIQDEYEGSQAVTSLKTKGLDEKAEALRKHEILTLVNSRTRKSWGANCIIPVWFLIWMLEWDYVRPHFLKFNSKFGVCSQIADAMRCKMATGSGSNDMDRELLDQSRKVMKSMEIVASRGDLTLLQSRTRDLLSIDVECRRLWKHRNPVWRSRSSGLAGAEAEEILSASSSSQSHGNNNNNESMLSRVADLEEAVDTEIIVMGNTMERLKSDVRMLALKLHNVEKKQNATRGGSDLSDQGYYHRRHRRRQRAYDSPEDKADDSDSSTSESSDEESDSDSESCLDDDDDDEVEESDTKRKRPLWIRNFKTRKLAYNNKRQQQELRKKRRRH